MNERLTPVGHQKITDLSAAVGLTLPAQATRKPPARMCYLRAETQSVRFRDDGSDPTASVGMLLLTTDPPFPYWGDLSDIKFIETQASAALSVAYYG